MSFSNPVVGGEGGELIRESIKSPNYVPNVSGWFIGRDGSAEFNDITIRGGAIVGGEIIIGPPTGPRVVIESDEFSGFITFPTGSSFELSPAIIESTVPDPDPAFALDFEMRSAQTVAGDYSSVELSSNRQDGGGEPIALLHAEEGANSSNVRVTPTLVELLPEVEAQVHGEIMIEPNLTEGNYPSRIIRGKTMGVSTSTTVGAADTAITNANATSVRLVTGVAYEVDVQIRTGSTAGAQAGALQGLLWKIWDGAVGGTQLGTSIQKFLETDGTGNSSQYFKFVFEHTGTTGARTVNLSAAQFTGTNTVAATTSTQFFMLFKRIGRASNVINL